MQQNLAFAFAWNSVGIPLDGDIGVDPISR